MSAPLVPVSFRGRLRWLVFSTWADIDGAALDAAFLLFDDAEAYAAAQLEDGTAEEGGCAITIVQAEQGLDLFKCEEASCA